MLNRNEFEGLPAWYETLKSCGKPLYIYGMGNGCEKVLAAFEEQGITPTGIFTSDDFKREREFHEFRLKTLSELEKECDSFAIACAFGTSLPEVMERIEALSQRHLLVYPEVSVAGDGYFKKDELMSRFDDAQKVYSLLQDDVSRETFENVLKFKVTGDIGYLKEYSQSSEAFENILKLGESEIYADLGAYNGDTVMEFISHTSGYRHIYAVEPSRRNFSKCVRSCMGLDGITLINAAVSDGDRIAYFSNGAGRQQAISDVGTPISVRSLDSILNGSECTYIKYDVEGEDIPAIHGSRKTIEKFRPKLRTGIYHRPMDILDIPLLVHSLVPEYRLYMRRPRYYPAWDLELFAVI